jgi:hypothetical protein
MEITPLLPTAGQKLPRYFTVFYYLYLRTARLLSELCIALNILICEYILAMNYMYWEKPRKFSVRELHVT